VSLEDDASVVGSLWAVAAKARSDPLMYRAAAYLTAHIDGHKRRGAVAFDAQEPDSCPVVEDRDAQVVFPGEDAALELAVCVLGLAGDGESRPVEVSVEVIGAAARGVRAVDLELRIRS
jgi:hypothetical protein